MATSYLNRTTPGVYITEIDAFGTGIVGVETSVPIFIGYTQFAGDPKTGESLYNKPVAISSMTEFMTYFGGPAPQTFTVSQVDPLPTPAPSPAPTPTPASFYANVVTAYTAGTPKNGDTPAVPATSTIASIGYAIKGTGANFNLYWQMRLFFANGGGSCYIVSVGSYWVDANAKVQYPLTAPATLPTGWVTGAIAAGDADANPQVPGLLVGLQAASYAVGPTMIVIPEACQLQQNETTTDYSTVVCAMMLQASSLQDRVAILDLPGCQSADSLSALEDCQSTLATAIAPQIDSASYAAAYAPAVKASVVSTSDVLYTSMAKPASDAANNILNNILSSQAAALYSGNQLTSIQNAIAQAFPAAAATAGTNTPQYSGGSSTTAVPAPTTASAQVSLDNLLYNSLPVYAQIKQQVATIMNVAPPSGLMAGVWTKSDNQSGVWNAPANIALASVIAPLYNMSDSEQGAFNVPINGQAIDILRAQTGRGTVVWGARTLDGNSLDYRYIQVRRTLIYVEQSIKTALKSYVFAPNDSMTWASVTSSISSFLTGLWQQGGLMGTKPSDAFTVSCGLGTTMTSQNILDGYMVVAVTLQMIHPAEFIELTFTQTMGS